MINFWKKLNNPFFVLAPMEDVTDCVFREIVSRTAKPDVMFTEFISADGLLFNNNKKGFHKLKFSERQRPVVAQIWSGNPETVLLSAGIVEKSGFDGIDINMGCPDRNVVKKHGGAGLIGDYERAGAIIAAVRKSCPSLPISVKTRYRNNKVSMDDWIGFLLSQKLHALTVYGRTPEQKSDGLMNWEALGEIVKMRNSLSPDTVLIGNGDVRSYAEGLDKHNRYGVDGIMIGRGVFENPWVFEHSLEIRNHTKDEHIKLLLQHMDLFVETWGSNKNFAIMKKFFKIYVKGFKGAPEVRDRLMKTDSSDEVRKLLGLIHKFK